MYEVALEIKIAHRRFEMNHQHRASVSWKSTVAILIAAVVCGSPCLWLLVRIYPYGAAAPPYPEVFKSAEVGDISAIRDYKLKGGDIQIRNWFGYNMLHPALESKQFKTADYLYEQGLRFDYPDRSGLRLSDEFLDDDNVDVLHWFINHGLAQSYVDDRGWTELHLAAGRGGPIATQELLKAGFDPRRKDLKGETPEVLAEKDKNWEVAEVLRTWVEKHPVENLR